MSDRSGPPTSSSPVLVLLGLSVLASLGLTVVYVRGGQPQLEGPLLFVALGGIGASFVLFAHRFMPRGRAIEPRERLASTAVDREWTELTLEGGVERIGRRRAIVGLFAAALGALGLALVFPIRSLGRAPGSSLFTTPWRRGMRAVGEDGSPVRAADVSPGSVVTVFPDGAVGSADGQALLIGLDPSMQPLPGDPDAAPPGLVCYSKVCTHAGCPVGLYVPATHELFCPCHQSVFDVLDAARPIGGPAARALPALPISVDADGYVVAQGDFLAPVGPGFWGLPT